MTAEEYMKIALNLAHKAAKTDEVPVGAVIVNPENGEILAQAYNQSAHSGDATAHAEILAITAACNALGTKYLDDCTLYVTLEPCVMCAGAIGWADRKSVV